MQGEKSEAFFCCVCFVMCQYPIQGPHGTGLPAFLDGHHGNIHTAALIVAITTHNLLRPQQPGGMFGVAWSLAVCHWKLLSMHFV